MLNPVKAVLTGIFIISSITVFEGCSDNVGSATVITTTDLSGNSMADVTVVLGDSNGALIHYGTTDANGQIALFYVPANATVTAAFICQRSGAVTPTYSLDVRYDVNGPVTLRVDGCSTPSNSSRGSIALGTVTLNVTNAISGITQNEVSTNWPVDTGWPPGLITQQTITITPYDLQSDGTLSLFVIGKDANDTSIGYGALLDQTFHDGMTVDITVDQPLSFLQYQISNMPSMTVFLCSDIYQGRTGKGGVWLGDCQNLSSAATSTTINVPYMPGLGDQFLYRIYVSTSQSDSISHVFSYQDLSAGPFAPILSNQSFDLNQALAAPNLTVSGTDTPTPTLSWNGVDPAATMVNVHAGFRLSSATYVFFGVDNVSAARTSITFPELPESLAAFRPTAVAYFDVGTLDTAGGAYRSSGGSYYQY